MFQVTYADTHPMFTAKSFPHFFRIVPSKKFYTLNFFPHFFTIYLCSPVFIFFDLLYNFCKLYKRTKEPLSESADKRVMLHCTELYRALQARTSSTRPAWPCSSNTTGQDSELSIRTRPNTPWSVHFSISTIYKGR